MEITLKQDDIEKAVKAYIQGQGIVLFNKTLDIDFAMGRKENGLSAVLSIKDIGLPIMSSEGPSDTVKALIQGAAALNQKPVVEIAGEQDTVKTAPATLAQAVAAGIVAPTPKVLGDDPRATEAAKAEPVAEAKTAEADEPVPVPKASTSLFGT